MTAGFLTFGVAGAALLVVWVLNLIRHGRLYVGYGVALIAGTVMATGAVAVGHGSGRADTTTGLMVLSGVLACGFILAYGFSQLTIVSNRVALVVQELAIERASASDSANRGVPGFHSPAGRDTIDRERR